MSDPIPTESEPNAASALNKRQAQGLRYSLKNMVEEVNLERKHSVLGRELLDATEIGKMFADKRHHKRTKK